MNVFSLTSKLHFMATHNPRLWEALYPHTAMVSVSVQYLLASNLIREVSLTVNDPALQKELQQQGKNVFNYAMKVATFENTMWFSGDELMLNPQPEPPGRQALAGALITMLGDCLPAPDLKASADSLKKIGASLMAK